MHRVTLYATLLSIFSLQSFAQTAEPPSDAERPAAWQVVDAALADFLRFQDPADEDSDPKPVGLLPSEALPRGYRPTAKLNLLVVEKERFYENVRVDALNMEDETAKVRLQLSPPWLTDVEYRLELREGRWVVGKPEIVGVWECTNLETASENLGEIDRLLLLFSDDGHMWTQDTPHWKSRYLILGNQLICIPKESLGFPFAYTLEDGILTLTHRNPPLNAIVRPGKAMRLKQIADAETLRKALSQEKE